MAEYALIGKPRPQLGARDKVTGKALFTDDIAVPNPLTVMILRATVASAKLLGVDTKRARAMAGVRAVITGVDFDRKFGVLPISKDEPPLARDRVRYVGEPVAAVAAETRDIAQAALRTIRVRYAHTTPCLDIRAALRNTDAPIHPELQRPDNIHKAVRQSFGDVAAGFEQAQVTVGKHFRFASVSHAFTEPHATRVVIDANGNLSVYSATQVPHYLHRALAEVLHLPMRRIRVIKPCLGGGFGGKSDPFPHEMIAAKLALISGRNTRVVLDREEVFYSHHGRHATDMSMRLGYHPQHGITAVSARIRIMGGAYGSFGIVTSYYNGVLLQGPYRLGALEFSCDRVYTNSPMCGAMRGHGGVNPRFAVEVLLDMACEQAGQDPCEARLAMVHAENSLTPNQFRITSCGLKQGLIDAMERSGWRDKFRKLPYAKGIGVACGFFISGSALPIHRDGTPASSVRLSLATDGSLTVYSGAADIGQGSDTILALMVAEVLGVALEQVSVVSSDTRLCPVDLGSYSSRVTFMAGNAARNAAIRMRRCLLEAACTELDLPVPGRTAPNKAEDFFRQGRRAPDFDADFLGANPDYADGFEFCNGEIIAPGKAGRVEFASAARRACQGTGTLETLGTYQAPSMGGNFKGAGAGLSPSYSFTAFITEVRVDPDTGFIQVTKTTCAHDAGMVLNPLAVAGQIHGSIHMGLGQALMEEIDLDHGAVQNAGLLGYAIPSAFEMPDIDIVPVHSDESEGPFGAKEAGEGVLAPFMPSVANAVHDAVGIRLTELPMRPDRVLAALQRVRRA